MAHFLIPAGASPRSYDVDNKLAPGSVWRVSIPANGSLDVGLYGGAGLHVRSNNPSVVPSIAERVSGNIRILTLRGSALGTSMIEVGPSGRPVWIALQARVGPSSATTAPNPITLAEQAKPGVNVWAFAATSAIVGFKNQLSSGISVLGSLQQTTIDAMKAHFALTASTESVLVHLDFVARVYQSIQHTLANSKVIFRGVDRATAALHFQKANDASWDPPPAYVLRGTPYIYFTPKFNTNFGKFCRMAMVMHECAHFANLGVADHAYEHQPAYATLTPAKATHNASSYPTFAAHVTRGFDQPRYGAGNPTL
jgi:hypothetical protein